MKKWGCIIGGCIGIVLATIIVIVFIVGGGIGLVYYFTKEPVQVVTQQLKYIKSGDLDSAYQLFSTRFRDRISPEDFQKRINTYPDLKRFQKVSFFNRRIQNKRAYLTGAIYLSDGTAIPIYCELVKEYDSWRVEYLTLNPA